MAFNGPPAQAIAFFEEALSVTMAPGANPFEFLVEALSNRSLALHHVTVRFFYFVKDKKRLILGEEIRRI
jgi:hypothetical protein